MAVRDAKQDIERFITEVTSDQADEIVKDHAMQLYSKIVSQDANLPRL